jgi:probable F420-dependent oxidoreductase
LLTVASTCTGSDRGLKVDGGVSSELASVPKAAGALERRGYDCCWTAEINHDPFLPLVLAAEHTSTIELGTSIAVAFARNPMTVANVGWDLQGYSQGRFILGLGSQVQAHIEKRFSMPWSQPVRRMREFILALRAIWSCWQDGTKLRFEGDFYTHKVMTPMFIPEPQPYPFPKVFVAAVGEMMTELCGEVADGMLAHAFTTKRYFDEVTSPALLRGMRRSGRQRSEFEMTCPAFVVTGENDGEFAAAATATRKQIAFYGSTPAYRKVLPSYMAGASCRPSFTSCLFRATGRQWVRSSTTTSSTRSPSSLLSMRWPTRSETAATAPSTAFCRVSQPTFPRPPWTP